jgi:hypothetical protein
VSGATYSASMAVAILLSACGTPESNAWGLPRDDVREIGRLVRAFIAGQENEESR